MIPIEEALAHCRALAGQPLPTESVAVARAYGRVLAEPVASALDLPPFAQSAMDGYALRAADIADAHTGGPVILPVAGEVAATVQTSMPRLPPGQVMRIFTGGAVPEGADAVVRQEDVSAVDGGARFVTPVPAGHNVRPRGDELAAGTPLLAAGNRLSAGRVAALAAAGLDRIRVRRRPRVRVLVTGDEVVAAGGALPLGAVPDANGPLLHSWLVERGIADVRLAYVKDDAASVEDALASALEEGDVVVTTGGVSVGEHDLVIPVARRLGVAQVFWGVRQKPGKPLFLGRGPAGTPVLGLPGNPGATLVGAAVYLRCLLDGLEGRATLGPRLRAATAATALPGDHARACWVRCVREIDDGGRMRLTASGHQASHMLSNLCEAEAFVWLEAGETRRAAGTTVAWLPIAGSED